MSKAKGKPRVPLGDRLAEAITTLRAIDAGDVPKDERNLTGPILAYLDGLDASKLPRVWDKLDHPLHRQLGELEAIVSDDEALLEQWNSLMRRHHIRAKVRHNDLAGVELGIEISPELRDMFDRRVGHDQDIGK